MLDAAATERDLVLAFQAGSPVAYQEIYRRYQRDAERACRRYLTNRSDVEDAVQETMLRVLRALPGFNGEYALGAWIRRIATNVSLDAVRRHGRRPPDEPLDVVIDRDRAGTDPASLLDDALLAGEIREVLERMPPTQQAALVLRGVEHRSHAEIGAYVGISPPQAKALVHRARLRFRQAWMASRSGAAALVLVPRRGLSRLWGFSGRAAEATTGGLPHAGAL
ncbi:MAG: RNA polymerase sigma factor, partial [Acidimicrobiales bacterium]